MLSIIFKDRSGFLPYFKNDIFYLNTIVMIKHACTFVILALFAFGCASSKKVVDVSVGTWDYVIKNTPEGDMNGNFIISKADDQYTGTMNSAQGTIDLENVTVVDKVLKCNFDYMGYDVEMTGTFEGAAFSGNVSVDYNAFDMTATKRE